jgi:membrane protein
MLRALKTISARTVRDCWTDDVFAHAAQVAFYFTLALFPLLLFLTSVFGLVIQEGDALRTSLFEYLGRVMPPTAFGVVGTWIDEVVSASSTGKLTFGLLVTLWSGSAGLDSLRTSLNAVYRIRETRPWILTRALSVALTVGLGAIAAVALLLIFYGHELAEWLLPWLPQQMKLAASYSVILVSLLLGFAVVYNLVPNHPTRRWQWFSPGAFIGIVLWLGLSILFRLYLGYFDMYARIYGSLGAVIVLLFWLYLNAVVVLVGGVVNKVVNDIRGD